MENIDSVLGIVLIMCLPVVVIGGIAYFIGQVTGFNQRYRQGWKDRFAAFEETLRPYRHPFADIRTVFPGIRLTSSNPTIPESAKGQVTLLNREVLFKTDCMFIDLDSSGDYDLAVFSLRGHKVRGVCPKIPGTLSPKDEYVCIAVRDDQTGHIRAIMSDGVYQLQRLDRQSARLYDPQSQQIATIQGRDLLMADGTRYAINRFYDIRNGNKKVLPFHEHPEVHKSHVPAIILTVNSRP